MNINKDFFKFIKPYLIKLKEKIGNDFVVFGSAPLYLFNVIDFNGDINDLDISIKDVSNIPKEAKIVTFQKDQNNKFYKIVIDDMNIDIASLWEGNEYFFEKIHNDSILVDGFKFASLETVEEWKKEMVKRYDRQKDKDYLEKVRVFRITENGLTLEEEQSILDASSEAKKGKNTSKSMSGKEAIKHLKSL